MAYVVERFAAWAERFRREPVTGELVHYAKRAVVDLHAAMISGAVTAPATLLERGLAEELDRGSARLALGRRATARAAALINGTAAHTTEVDDIFRDGIFHPGAPTIPAALALAETRGASGAQFLRAVMVGYEVATRIGAAMGRAHYRHWHSTGTIGCFGACAAAADLLGLDATRFAHALATVATFSAGLQQAFRMDSMSKPLHAGRAAEAGLTAALAAAEGVAGSLDVLEGETGFGRAMGDDVHRRRRERPGLDQLDATPNTDQIYPADAEIVGDIPSILEAIVAAWRGEPKWTAAELGRHREGLRAAYYAGRVPGKLNPSDVVDLVRQALPREAIATTDVGSHKLLVGQGWAAYAPRSVLMTNGLSSMGYSLPAAIVAKLLEPARPVVCFVGDGGLAMVQSELRLAAGLGLGLLVVVFCDDSLNRIEIKQAQRNYPGWGTALEPTDIPQLARAMACEGVTVESAAALGRALGEARPQDRPLVIGARIDPAQYRAQF